MTLTERLMYASFQEGADGALLDEAHDRIKELELALQDARLFANVVECWGRTDCEIYKHELKASADLSLERIDKVIEPND